MHFIFIKHLSPVSYYCIYSSENHLSILFYQLMKATLYYIYTDLAEGRNVEGYIKVPRNISDYLHH